jgi:hypothetical protein
MNYLPSKRGTLLVLSGTHVDPDKHHLFVICTDECDNGNFLIAPLCTWTNSYCDPTCILQPHEHQFIKQKSYVLYRKCQLERFPYWLNRRDSQISFDVIHHGG